MPIPTAIRFGKRLAAILSLFLLAGCFGIGTGKQSSINPATDSGRVIQDVYAMVTWIDLGILVVVFALFFFAVFRYRTRKENQDEIPTQVHGSAAAELVWTIVPAVILIFIAVPTWSGIFRATNPPPGDQLQVKAIGHQWWWEFQYTGQNVTTANELVLPENQVIVIKTSSVDVNHAFWAPRLAGKQDSMQNRENLIWFTSPAVSSEPSENFFYGQCAEFCGTSHANMRFRVRVVTQQEFDAWLGQQALAPAPESDDARAGRDLFLSKGCVACHTIKGNPVAAGVLGPNLNDLKSRTTLASGIIENSAGNLAAWIKNPQAKKPGTLMGIRDEKGNYQPIPMTDQEAAQLAAYLSSPPGEAQAAQATSPQAASAAMTSGGGGDETAQALIAGKGICFSCHIVPGVPTALGTVGPSLAGLASRARMAGGAVENTPENLKKWLRNPQALKPTTIMPPAAALTDQEIDTVVQFLMGLK
jgi:cytochrome c oxidase subunit 2